MTRPRLLLIAASLFVASCAAWALQAAVRTLRAQQKPPASMAAMLPQGALLTIESPDFAALLHTWNASPEQRAWFASDNYSVFTNSRLFGRLNDARAEFEGAAAAKKDSEGSSFDGDFLTQVAGKQSIFAWYDIGNLEFVYITRLAPAQSARIALLKSRASFAQRQAGGQTFYIRESPARQGQSRIVAFAEVSSTGQDLLILATREDLIAGTLQLIAKPGAAVTQEPWFADASAALPAAAPDHPPVLHMVLNLDRIVTTPQFRSYWVQRNITDMGRYRAAVSDLYPDPASSDFGAQFHEERALLLKSSDNSADQSYLRTLAAIVPASGVYRATATHDPALAVTALEEKLLGRAALTAVAATEAPDPTLEAPQSGSVSDLETYIDTPALVSPTFSNSALTAAFNAASLDSILTWSTALPPATAEGLWVPIHSAVILDGSSAWNPASLQSALQQSLRGTLTTSTLGIDFHSESVALDGGSRTIYSLTGPRPLFFATLDEPPVSTQPTPLHLVVLTDERALLLNILHSVHTLTQTEAKMVPAPLTYLASFNHTTQRAPYHRLTALIDGTNRSPAKDESDTPANPPFFSRNLDSLSGSFAALDSQSIQESRDPQSRDGAIVRQSVLYQWRKP